MSPKLTRVHHVGIAVTDLEAASVLYAQRLRLPPGIHRTLPERGVEVQFFDLPGTKIELLAPLGDSSPLRGFLERRGPGLHHVCYEVDDIRKALSQLARDGFELIDTEPRPGAEDKLVAFVHPKSTGGVLIELQAAE